ncbi:MAG: enoyl-CoA hydratase/isomerase family protein [Candidatus Hodarchaeota archaeon]
MSDFETIELEIDESIGLTIILLNRPEQYNALNYQLAEDLFNALTQISKNSNIRSLVITGKGKAFCGGGDLIEFKKAKDPSEFISKLANKLHDSIKLLKTISILSIAAINGACFGAGLGFACACDLRICSENATFGSAFVGVGLSPDSSSTVHLPKIVGLSLANDMLLTNRILNAKEALKYNLVSQVADVDKLIEQVKKIALKIKNGAPIALQRAKKLINESFMNSIETHLTKEAEDITFCAGTEDFQEGVNAFFEKRDPLFKGK